MTASDRVVPATTCGIHCGVFPALAQFMGMARGGHG